MVKKQSQPTEVEDIIKTLNQRRFAEGKFQGKEIGVKLRENKYALLFRWEVRISVFSEVDGYSNINSKERGFRKKESAAKYFEELVKQYNLTELGGASQ